jgi:hypothetical protein
MLVKADLHIHSCLSPCGSLEMSPSAIVDRAVASGLQLIALTDHNSALNCPTMKKICESRGDLRCFYGMEVTSTEEVHLLTLFDDCDASIDFSEFIFTHLPRVNNDPLAFGDQVYVDESENIIGEVDVYLGNGVDLSIDDIEKEVHSRGGMFIPAHIDREMYSMTSQLGFLPDGNYNAVEFSRHFLRRNADPRSINPQNYIHVTGSDSHYLDDVGTAGIIFDIDEISFDSLCVALRQRKVTSFF